MSNHRLCFVLWTLLAAGIAGTALAYDLTKDKCAFAVAVAHLDTQWGWERQTSYTDYIPNTLHDNFALFRKYPRYVFSFAGAFRYWIAEQGAASATGAYKKYLKGDFDTLKSYIAQGRWAPVGGMIDETDVNMPCAESMCRNFLYGNGYYEEKFGKRAIDIYLPDCFGFGYALPTIASHFGMRAFSSCKFESFGGWFDPSDAQSIMRWFGVDGSFLYTAIHPTFYNGEMDVNASYGNAVQKASGMWIVYDYYGTGDMGGAPSDSLVNAVCNVPGGQYNGAYYFPAASDSLWKMLIALEQAGNPDPGKLVAYDGEFIMETHGTGCYTTRGDVKTKFRNMELTGLQAEPAAVMANKLAGTSYPQARIWRAWFKGIDHAFHDDLTGTSDASCYTATWDGALRDLDSQATTFTDVKNASNTAVAGILNTQVTAGSVPLVVYNPLGLDRQDVAQATVTFSAASQYAKIVGPDGVEVPSQVIAGGGTTSLTVLFLADVPSIGYAVYSAAPSATGCPIQTGLSVSADGGTLSNNDYTVSIDNTGDVSQIVDKKGGNRNLLQSASRWELRPDNSVEWPAWEILRADAMSSPTGVVDQGVAKTVTENGPVRVSVKVTRTKNSSNYTHYYRLCAGQAGRLVVADNTVDWKSTGNLLKASFYLACSNANATYGLGVGTIDRPNSGTDKRYELPAQQWATIGNGTFGVAIMNNYKYGWGKLANNNLLLTIIHSPSGGGLGDIWPQSFSYALCGYSGDWKAGGVEQQCQRFQLPLSVLQTTPHAGSAPFGKAFSLVRVSDPTKIMIMAVKKAEKSDDYVVRVREIAAAASSVKLLFSYNVTAAKLTNGMEDDAGATAVTPGGAGGNEVAFSVTKYQIKTVKVTLGPTYVNNGTAVVPGAAPGSIPRLDERAFRVVLPAGARGSAKFLLAGAEKVRAVTITDIRGRAVRTLYNGAAPIGPSSRIAWDGADAAGLVMPSGIYFVNLRTDRTRHHATLRLVR